MCMGSFMWAIQLSCTAVRGGWECQIFPKKALIITNLSNFQKKTLCNTCMIPYNYSKLFKNNPAPRLHIL